mgnify:CR=1 FL=1
MERFDELLTELRSMFPHGHRKFILACLDEMELHSQKNADYAKGGDPLGNFHRVSLMLNSWGLDVSPALVAFIYMLKQVDAVGNMLGQKYEGEVEGINKRLQDISVYAKLIGVLYDEQR